MSQQEKDAVRDQAGLMLSWENLGAQAPAAAFWQTLRELIFRPASFFKKMSLSGGLHEPLTFYWLILSPAILLAFPLALAHFALTAPEAAKVSAELYSRHLLAPRAAGFLAVTLPVVLVVAGLLVLLCGSLFHLGARFFGARDWEGSVSVWCYSNCAALAAGAAAIGVGCVISVLCYLVSILLPESRAAAGAVAAWGVAILAIAGGVVAAALLLINLVCGSMQSFRLDGARASGSVLCGLALVVVLGALCLYVFPRFGARTGFMWLVVYGAFIAVLSVVLQIAALYRGVPEGGSRGEAGP